MFVKTFFSSFSSEKEEDQSKSQGLSETNSASFASLNTLSTVSESALNTATADQSRPKSAG
jgi:hypothetical protein